MVDPQILDDSVLVAQAGAGSEHAFRALYRAYVRPVYWIAHALVGTTSDAEDVTQETFLAAWRKLPDLELAGSSLLPWLATICRYQAANRVRRQRRDREHISGAVDETVPDTVDVAQQVIDRDLAQRIADAVAGLGDLDRSIFQLCATEGCSYQAAAEQLGVSHGVVRNRLSRIRTQVRNEIGTESS